MKNLILLAASLVLLGSAAAREIEFLTPELIDHGRVEEGTELEGRIRFVNQGGQTLKIKRVQSGCGCTTARLVSNEIAPGDTADIRYILRTKQYTGLMRKAVTVQFEPPAPPNKRYILQADVYTDILLNPKYLHFRDVDADPDTLVTEILTIHNRSDRPLICHRIATNAEAIRAAPAKMTIAPGDRGRIEVSLLPSEAGRRTFYLSIDTDHELKPNLRIPVFAHVR